MLKPFNGNHPKIAESAFVEESAQVIGKVELGEHSSIWFNAVLRADTTHIKIGKRSNVQDGSVLHVYTDIHPVIIGDYVTLAHGVIAHGCTIHSCSLIGMGAVLLDRVEVGEGSIIAAGSVVTQGTKIPARSMVMGVPAKVVRSLSDEEMTLTKMTAEHYVLYKDEYKRMQEEDKKIRK